MKSIPHLLAVAALFAASAANAQRNLPEAPVAALHGQVLQGPILQGPGGIVVPRTSDAALQLTLDQAVDMALLHNAQLHISEQNIRIVQGQTGTAFNALLPSLHFDAQTAAHEINLAALGFKPSSLANFGINPKLVPLIVKVNTTSAQVNVSQVFFNLPAYNIYRAAQAEATVANLDMGLTRGNVVMIAGGQYLRAVADEAQIKNAEALVKQDEEQLRQATERDQAGVGIRLDVLRAKVQLQTEQQALVSAQNAFAKDKIALARTLGLPAEQDIQLTDTAPYAELTAMPLDDAKALAYQRRKDYTSLETQLQVAGRVRRAVRFEYLPTVAFTGFYGVLGETTGLYHGVFTAEGSINIPIFREAQFRAERKSTQASYTRLQNQIASLRIDIDEQIRSSMLDVQASSELVKVARSNVDLAHQELDDATARFTAGVDDNLPVIEAQAVLVQAQSRLVETEYESSVDKLALARNTGVVETQYKTFLGR